MAERPPIPADLKRRILVESGHRCAIPTCRYPTTEIAHIVPWDKVKRHDYNNLIALCPNCHTRYHNSEIDRKSMIMYKQKMTFLSDRYSQLELHILNHLRTHENTVIPSGFLSVYSILEDKLIENIGTLVSYQHDNGTEDIMSFVATLTEKGKQLLEDWENPKSDLLTYLPSSQ